MRTLVGGKRFCPARCEVADIEEMSRSGMRLRTGADLRKDDSVVLYSSSGAVQERIQVVWAREDGLIEKRSTGRPGRAMVVGCRIRRQKHKASRGPSGELMAPAVRVSVISACMALIGLIVYTLASILSIWA